MSFALIVGTTLNLGPGQVVAQPDTNVSALVNNIDNMISPPPVRSHDAYDTMLDTLHESQRQEQLQAEEAAKQAQIAQAAEAAKQAAIQATQAQQALVSHVSYANTYTWGQCTWYVASQRSVPSDWGNASTWLGNAQALGWATGPTARPGAIAWTGDGYYGHVAIVQSVSGGVVTVSEMNAAGGPGVVTTSVWLEGHFYYIY